MPRKVKDFRFQGVRDCYERQAAGRTRVAVIVDPVSGNLGRSPFSLSQIQADFEGIFNGTPLHALRVQGIFILGACFARRAIDSGR